MKLGFLTTYNTKCGIAEYSKNIINALRRREDVDVTVLGSLNHGAYDIREHENFVCPVFEVQHWSGYNGFAKDKILEQEFDVIHVQYQSMLYNYDEFVQLFDEFKGVKVITYHDNCQPPGFPHTLFDKLYSHRSAVGIGDYEVIPFGIEKRKPVVKTFGLGRSRWDIIKDVCDIKGYTFEHSFGDQNWLDTEELNQWLRASDVIVLWYDDVGAAGSSQAARQAISTRRPVVVNDVTWFKDLPESAKNFVKVQTTEELQQVLEYFLENTYIDQNSWDRVVDKFVKDYKELLHVKA